MSIFSKPKPKPIQIQQPVQPKDRRFVGGATGGAASSTLNTTGGRGTFLGG